jgi:hypothetical protein
VDESELSTVLESLATDNESLKRDNTELQGLLSESREELRTLQEELDEHRAEGIFTSRHRHRDSIGSSVFDDTATLASPFMVGTAPAMSTLSSIFGNQKPGPSVDRRAASTERFPKHGLVCVIVRVRRQSC